MFQAPTTLYINLFNTSPLISAPLTLKLQPLIFDISTLGKKVLTVYPIYTSHNFTSASSIPEKTIQVYQAFRTQNTEQCSTGTGSSARNIWAERDAKTNSLIHITPFSAYTCAHPKVS